MVLSDFTVFGALSQTHAKICKVMDMAVKMGAHDRIERFRWWDSVFRGAFVLCGYADIFIETYKQVA
jgi:hypothetical protein